MRGAGFFITMKITITSLELTQEVVDTYGETMKKYVNSRAFDVTLRFYVTGEENIKELQKLFDKQHLEFVEMEIK